MIIDIAKLKEEPAAFQGAEPEDLLQLEAAAIARPAGPVSYDLLAQLAGRELVVQGTLTVPLECTCGRCAENFSTSLTISDFLRDFDLSDGRDSVDLTDDLREEVLLHLPNFPVCSSDCRGRCPRCGRNLNLGRCGCRARPQDLRWSGLDGLKLT